MIWFNERLIEFIDCFEVSLHLNVSILGMTMAPVLWREDPCGGRVLVEGYCLKSTCQCCEADETTLQHPQ